MSSEPTTCTRQHVHIPPVHGTQLLDYHMDTEWSLGGQEDKNTTVFLMGWVWGFKITSHELMIFIFTLNCWFHTWMFVFLSFLLLPLIFIISNVQYCFLVVYLSFPEASDS